MQTPVKIGADGCAPLATAAAALIQGTSITGRLVRHAGRVGQFAGRQLGVAAMDCIVPVSAAGGCPRAVASADAASAHHPGGTGLLPNG